MISSKAYYDYDSMSDTKRSRGGIQRQNEFIKFIMTMIQWYHG